MRALPEACTPSPLPCILLTRRAFRLSSPRSNRFRRRSQEAAACCEQLTDIFSPPSHRLVSCAEILRPGYGLTPDETRYDGMNLFCAFFFSFPRLFCAPLNFLFFFWEAKLIGWTGL